MPNFISQKRIHTHLSGAFSQGIKGIGIFTITLRMDEHGEVGAPGLRGKNW